MSKPLAVITGASRGIGFELAKLFAANGFDLLVTSSSDSILDAARRLADSGAAVEHFQADLATFAGVESLCEWINAKGPVEAAALNAGIGVGGDFVRHTTLEDNLRLIAINVDAVIHMAKRLGEDMVGRHRGRILITSSIAATMPVPFLATYAASKAFVQSFAVALREELRDSGVTVTSLMPGPTDTAWFGGASAEGTKLGKGALTTPARVARQGFKAMMAGREHVVAGSLMNSLQASAGKLFPAHLVARVARHYSKPDQ